MFVTVTQFHSSLIFEGKAGYTRASQGRLLALPANGKLLTVKNDLAYHEMELIIPLKSFIVQAPESIL
jgi:hypothetical protein